MAKPSSPNSKKASARVAVVAAGVVSPLGFGLAETLESLRKARDCVSPVTRFSVAQCDVKPRVKSPMTACSLARVRGFEATAFIAPRT